LSARPRVLVLVKGLGAGGAERIVVDLVRHRDAEAFHYEVAYVLADQAALAPEAQDAGVVVHGLGARGSPDLRWMWRLRRLLRRGSYDVVHAHLPYSAALGRIVALTLPPRARPVFVYTEHSLWPKAAVLTRLINRATVGFDRALFVVSERARDALPRVLQARARVLVHGVDRARAGALADRKDEIRRDVRAELGLDPGEVLALTVANIRSEKGHDVLLAAASEITTGDTAVRFVWVGDGPRRDALTAARDAGGLTRRVQVLGARQDVVRLMTAADLFVLPSRQEGLPVALMEAMSAGLPVVATTVGGVPDIVTDGREGLLVPPGRADLLAHAVGRLVKDDGLRRQMAEASLQRSQAFDVAAAARSVESVYGALLDARDGVPLVLHVVPTAAARGAQREASALARRLDAPGVRRHQVMSLFAGPRHIAVDVALDHPGGDQPAVGFDARLVLRLRRALRKIQPTVVVAHGGDALKYLVPAVVGRRTPLVYYATGTFAAAHRRARVRAWGVLVRRAAVVAAEGDEVLAEARRLWRLDDRLVLAPNGRDPEEFFPDPARPSRTGAPRLAFVGALTPGKRPTVFLEVVAALRDRGVALSAVVCGDGPLAPDLHDRARRAGVELLGTRPDVAEILRQSDVFVFPSAPTGEGMPGVLIEAGLCGLPAVATNVPGVTMIVEDAVTGFVVPVDDVGAMVEATARLVEDAGLRRRMGEAARRRNAERFTIDAVAERWLSFLQPLVARAVSSKAAPSQGSAPARSGPDGRHGPTR